MDFHFGIKSISSTQDSYSVPYFSPEKKVKKGRRVTFIDKVRIYVKGGTGGMGCPSAGGCGGNGGDIFVQCKDGSSLARYRTLGSRRQVAAHGTPYLKTKGAGRPGKSKVLTVPPGTIIYDDAKTFFKDLNQHGEKVLVAKGGQGGSHRTVRFNGIKGERRSLTFELKLLGDVSLVGFPNAGKSTFLRSISNASPKVADYPFTTLRPTLGEISYPDHTVVTYTDLPGLIEEAHLNRGMGHQFLRHVERTKAVLMMVDIRGFQLKEKLPLRNAVETIAILMRELFLYKRDLLDREMVIALNKIDTDANGELAENIQYQLANIDKVHLPFLENEENDIVREKIIELCRSKQENVFPISAINGTGLEILTDKMRDIIEKLKVDSELLGKEVE